MSNTIPAIVKEELIQIYPEKVAPEARRADRGHEHRADGACRRSRQTCARSPGIITQRGCTYAGCKGVVIGPSRDILSITHGPIGCGFYSWLTRRNQTRPPSTPTTELITYCLSTDMQEEQIVFGGEKKLKAAIKRPTSYFIPRRSPCSPPVRWD